MTLWNHIVFAALVLSAFAAIDNGSVLVGVGLAVFAGILSGLGEEIK